VEVWWTYNVRPLRLGEEIKKIERKKKPPDENIYVCILLCRAAIKKNLVDVTK